MLGKMRARRQRRAAVEAALVAKVGPWPPRFPASLRWMVITTLDRRAQSREE